MMTRRRIVELMVDFASGSVSLLASACSLMTGAISECGDAKKSREKLLRIH
jgi:hypothetical protein